MQEKKIKKENIMRKGRVIVGASEESIAGLNPAQSKKETPNVAQSRGQRPRRRIFVNGDAKHRIPWTGHHSEALRER